MEEEQRKKKLEAGKERLAAFRKKKAKKKKKPANGEDMSSHQGADGNLADASSCSDVQSLTGDSDQVSVGSYTSGDEWSAEESDLHSAVYYQTKLGDASRRVSELEEMVEGKQLALDKVVLENTQLREQKKTGNVETGSGIDDLPRSQSDTMVNTSDLRSALSQRDQIIQQLTTRLRATAEKSSQDYTVETQTLAQQVALLQQQLQQAGETLHGQLNQHNVSAQALQEAKAEILALQNLLRAKEDILAQLTLQVSEKNEEVNKLELYSQDQLLKHQEMAASFQEHETRTKNLESSLCQHEERTRDLVEKYELREKELVLCIQQHETREKELEVYVNQCVSNEATFQETIVRLEGLLATAVKEKEIVMSSMESTGQDEQQKIAKLTLELQNLGKQRDTVMVELEQVKIQNKDLESLRQEIEELQCECSLKQTENDELRNKINDQQGETLGLKSQLELLLQDGENSGHELEVLRELMETKEKVHEAELQEKNIFISQLESDVKILQEERTSYVTTIETLNSQILTLQSDLNASVNETVAHRTQAELFKVELKKLGREADDVGDKFDGNATDQIDGADAFAVESELEVRRVHASAPKSLELESALEDSVTVASKKISRNVDAEVSERLLQEGVVKTETLHSLGSGVSVIRDGGNVMKPKKDEVNLELVSLSEEITRLKQVCKEHLDRISELENRNSVLETEIESVRSEVATSTAKVLEIETQNDILVSQNQDSSEEVQSLSSELHNTCDKLKETNEKSEIMSKELSDQVKENVSLVSRLEQVGEEMKVTQIKLTESESALRELEEDSNKKKAELEGKCSDYQNQLKELQESFSGQHGETDQCEKHMAEINRLQKELAETKSGLEEVMLGAEKTQEDLQTQCDQYAAEAAELQAELTKAQEGLSQDKDQITTFEEKCNILSNEMSFLQQELTRTKEEFSNAHERLDKKEELYSSLKEQDDKHVKEILQLQKDLDTTKGEMTQEQEKSLHFQDEITTLKGKLDESNVTMDRNLEEMAVLRGQLDSQSVDSSQTNEALEKGKMVLEQLKLDLKESESQREILAVEVASMQQQFLSVCAEIMKLNLHTRQSQEEMKKLQNQCMSQEARITELTCEVENAQKLSDNMRKEYDDEYETLKSDIEKKELEISKLREEISEANNAKQLAETTDKEKQRQLNELHAENLKCQNEIEELTVQQLSSQERAEKAFTELEKANSTLASNQSELEQANAKIQELSLGAEQSQAELQVKCADQAAEIAKLVSEKTQVCKELEEVTAEAEIEKTELKTKLEHLQTEIRSLQSEHQQMKMEHSRTLEEERNVNSDIRSQFEVSSSESKKLQKAVDIANKEVSETRNEMEKLRSDYEVQLQGYLANIEELKSETKGNKTEIDQFSTKLQCEEDAKREIQNLYEKSLTEIQSLQNDLKVNREVLEDVQNRVKTLDEVLNIEQAARMELQSQFGSLSYEFDRVNTSEKKIQKDIVRSVQRIKLLIGLTTISVEHSQETLVSNLDDGVQVLEESVRKLKLNFEDQITKRESLTEKVSELDTTKSELNNKLAAMTESEDILKSEMEEMKAELENTKSQLVTASADIKTYQTKMESLQEEKEILKVNFDSCMEEMQQKLSEQENQSRSLQSQLMETAKDKDRDDNEVKMMYESHITELEEKLLKVEAEFTHAKKTLSDYSDAESSTRETYEHKIAEMEEKVSSFEIQNTRLQEQQSRFNENLKQEKEDIRGMFESQISELEENCKSLETTMLRLQDQLSEATKTHEQEKEHMEQNFDIQLSEVEDKCRVFEMTNGKLKRQMDEMMNDFRSEKEDIQKMYESQLLDLEDRCSQSELTANKSMQHVSDISKDFGDERETYELRMQDLEERCFELEKSKDDALDRLELVTESAQQERKTLQESLSGKLSDLQKKYTVMETEYAALKDVLEERQQTHEAEVERLRSEYQTKVTILEEKCQQLPSQCVEEGLQARENVQVESVQGEIDSLKEMNERYKAEVQRLSVENEDFEKMLETERNLLQKATNEIEELEVKYKKEVQSNQMGTLTTSATDEAKNVKELKSKLDILNSELSSSNQELSKEKQRLKASKLAVEKLKKELKNQKVTSDQEILSLNTRLESWEVELIQRREFVEQEKTAANAGIKRQAELETLVKNYERKVEDLTNELHCLKSKYDENQPRYLHLDVHSKQNVSVKQAPQELKKASDPTITDAFEPEPETPELLQSQPEFPVYQAEGLDVPVEEVFKSEVNKEGFMVFEADSSEDHMLTNTSMDQNGNVQVESHSSRLSENLISGDGFQPEVDHSRTDTFQPEDAGEFKPEDDIDAQTLLPIGAAPHVTTTSASTQTEISDLSQTVESESEPRQLLVTPTLDLASTSDDVEVIRKELQHEKDVLEEEYVKKMKKLEVDLQYDHQTAMKEYQKEVDKKMQQKLTAMKDEKHQAFIKALRKARKQLEEKHKMEVEKIRHEMSRMEMAPSPELSESDLVKQLHKDNQELAEARDALLEEISNTQQSQTQGEATWQSQPEHRSRTSSPKAVHGADSQEVDSTDPHPSKRFLEELESLSQRSVSDLPLEWELTVSTDDGVFDRELDDDGLCARHECLEMKKKYQRLFGLYQQAQGESVFIEELSPDRNQTPGLGRRQRIDSSEQGSDTTGSSHLRTDAVNTSQDVSEGDYFEESFKDKIQKLEAENIALEKKLCNQLEMFGFEKQQLKQRCENLKVNLDNTSSSRQNVEEKLIKQDEMIQSSISQLSELGVETSSVETQTELSGDISVSPMAQGLELTSVSVIERNLDTTDEMLDTTLSSKQDDQSISAANMSTPKSQKKNVRTELNFGERDPGISMVEQSRTSSASSHTDSVFLPSIDHMEHMMFSDSDSICHSPTGRTPQRRKKKESPIEISFNTTSLVSMKRTEGGTLVNQEQIELKGTVNSAGSIVPEEYAKVALEIHHAEMVEEISRLKKELHDSKAMYAHENAMLKEQVERELIARQLWIEKKVPDDKLIKELPLQTDVIELRQEVAVLKENNKMLMDENKHLSEQAHEKQCLMLHFRDKFDTKAIGLEDVSHGADSCTHGADTQLLILQKQRDELVQEIQDFHDEHERLLSVLDARTAMEETLRREKEMLLEKLVQYEDAQSITREKHTELEFLRGEQKRMEQLLLLKDETERQLLKQKRLIEEDMYDIEGKLKEREAFLEEEKHRLLKEVKEKNLAILKLETMTGGSDGTRGHGARSESRRASTGHLPSGGGSSSGQAMPLDTSYDEAIEILRNKLRLEYDVKEAELNEQHASDKAAFWQQHNKKLESLRVQHESQMETLRGELDAERDLNSQHDLHLQEQHQQTVARLRDELEEEKAAMLDTVLKQLGELTHRQIQQAKHENRTEVDLQVQAMKLTMEQIHTSQLNLIQAELEAKHATDMTNLRQTLTKELKEQRNSQESTLDKHSGISDKGAIPSLGPVDEKLTDRYEQLVVRINQQLEQQVLRELQEAPAGGDPGETNTSEAIRQLLESQRDDISQLRSQLLSEYETVLQSRTQNVTSQSEQVEQLQREIEALQSQYETQIKTFQEKLQHAAEPGGNVRSQEQHTKELEELRTYYEKKVHDMEKTFSDEISDLRTKYEDQISNLVSNTDQKDSGSLSDSKESMAFAKEREYVQRTTMLTVITDSDESSATESPRGANIAVSRLADFDKKIQEQENKITDLEKQLEEERGKVSLSAEEVKSLKDQLNDFEKKVGELNDLISEKENVITNLNCLVSDKENVITDLNCLVSEKEKVISLLEDEREKYMNELQEKEIKSDSSSGDLAQEKHELLIKLEELEHRHTEELESVRHELEHENKVEVETMQSEFKVQLEIELKRQAAELQKIQEQNMKNLEIGQSVGESVSSSEIEGEVTQDEVQTSPVKAVEIEVQTDEVMSIGATAVTDVVDSGEGDVVALRREYEAKIEALKAEVDQLQAEKEELSTKHQHDLDNLKSLLSETEEKYDKLVADMEKGDSPELEELMKEKYDQQLELSKQLMQQEFTETLESERSRFMERHRKMMDNFMADRTQEAEELKAKHEKELQELRDQLGTQQAEILQIRCQHAEELEKVQSSQVKSGDEADGNLKEGEENGKEQMNQVVEKDEKTDDGEEEDGKDGDRKNEKMKELIEKHRTELEEVKEKWEKKLEDLKTNHTEEMSAAALDTETVKSELETANQRELQDLETRLTQLHQREVERLQEELRAVEERLTHSHEREMERLRTEHQDQTDRLIKQHKNELSDMPPQQTSPEHREPLREVSEVFLPPQTTPLLSATDLDSTQESETEAEFLMKSTPRDPLSDTGVSRGSTPDDLMTTRSFAAVVRGGPPIVSRDELEEKDQKIQQLQVEVERLRSQLERVESEEQLLTGRRVREAEEGSNLVTMLRSDLDRISTERDAVQSSNDRLLQILSDSVKNYMSVEDAINKKLARLVNQSRSRPSSGTPREDRHGSDADLRRESRGAEYGARAASPRSDRGDANTSQDSTALEETSILSCNTDEGLDLSQRLTESIFAGPDLDPEGEEILTDARGRLQTSVNHLLEMIEKTTQQLMDAKKTQQELVETLALRSTESEVLEVRCTEMEERLREQVSAKEYLALELHKAEGLISGYSTERDGLEQKMDNLEEQRQALALELETTQTKLHEFQNSQAEIQSRQNAVDRQEQILRENVGEETQALLREVNTLTVERRELEKQTQHQLERSQSRIHELEVTIEEIERLHEQALEEKRDEVEDVRLQLDSVERQLKASKQFLSEQSGEREQEREEYQREVERLQQLLQDRNKKQSAAGRLQQEVQDLSEQLENRIASEGELDEQTRRLQQVLQDKELTAAELKQWVAQLEKEADEKTATEQELRQKIDRLEKKLTLRPVVDETSDSSLNSTAEQHYVNPDLMSPDRRSPLRRQMTLEEELEKTRKSGQELALEKEALQQQVQEQLLQISALKNQLDDMRHYGGEVPTVTHTSQLRERLAVERESLEMKEEEVSSLQEQKEKLRQQLEDKEVEVQKLRAELSDVDIQPPPPDPDQRVREENATLKAEVEKLLGHQEDSVSDVGMPRFAQDLLDEKNREIDDLTEQISQLQMALEATSVIDDSVRENDELELLREELRQKSETITELEEKLSSSRGGQFYGEMSLTDADRSLLETSFTEKTNFQQELEEIISQREEEMSDLRKELETSQLALTEVESEKITLRTDLEERVKELEEELESARTTLREADNKTAEQKTEDRVEPQEDLQHVDHLRKELELAREALRNAEEKLAAQDNDELNKLQKELEESQQALKVSEGNADNSQLQKELEETKESLKESEEKVAVQTESNVVLRKEIEDMQIALQDAEEKLKAQDTETESELRKDIDELRLSLSDAEERLTGKDCELKEARQSMKEAQQALKEAEEKLQDNEELNELQKELDEVQKSLRSAEEEKESLRSRLGDRESELLQMQEERDMKLMALEQVSVQIDSFQEEIKSLTTFQNELQKDFDTVQAMLEEKEKEIETLTRELTESRVPPEGATSDIQDKYESEVLNLKKTIQEKVNIIEEKEEELYVLNEKLELQDSLGSELSTVRQQLADTEVILDEERLAKQHLEDELKVIQQGRDKVPVISISGDNTQAVESISVSISQLQEQLSQKEEKLDNVRAEMDELKERLSEQQKELNDARDKLQEKEVLLEKLESGGEKDGLIAQLQSKVKVLEEELQKVRVDGVDGSVEELKGKIEDLEARLRGRDASEMDGGEVVKQDEIVVSFAEEVEGVPAERDDSIDGEVDLGNETRNIVDLLKDKVSSLEEELEEKEQLIEKLKSENSEGMPSESDVQKQLMEKTQLYDQLLTDKIILEKSVIELENKLEEKLELLEKIDFDKNELSEKEEMIAKLQQQLQDKEVEGDRAESHLTVSEDVAKLHQAIEEKSQKILELETECKDLKQQLESGPEDLLRFQQQVQEKDSNIQELQTKYEDLKQQMREEASRLEEEIQKIHQIQESQPDIGVLEEAKRKASEMTAELEKAHEKLAATEMSLEQTLVQLAERDEQLKALFAKGSHQLNLSTHSQEETSQALEDVQQEVYELSLELREKDEDIERLQTTLTATEEELETKSAQLRNTESELEKRTNHLRHTEERLKQTSFELTNAQQDNLSSSLPLDLGDSDNQLMTRSESEPALNNWRRESHLFRSRLHEVESLARQQKQELCTKNRELSLVRKQLEQWLSQERGEGDAGTVIVALQHDLQERDRNIQLLQAEIDELNETLLLKETQIRDLHGNNSFSRSSVRESTPPESEQQIRHLKLELRKAKSALAEIHQGGDYLDRTPEGSATEEDQSPVRLGDEARNLRREVNQLKEELELYKSTASMSAREFVKKVMELREELSEEHKNHIRDIQERLKMDAESQLTTLQLRHEDEIRQLRQNHEQKMQVALTEQKQELEKQHKSDVNRLISEHQHEMDIIREEGLVRDDASVTTTDSVAQRLMSDVHTTNQMDNRILDQLERPDGVGGEDSDTSLAETSSVEAAPPGAITSRLQTLISRLHKKGVYVLTLSELQFLQRHMPRDRLDADVDLDALHQAWERERETLLSTVNSLKELLTRVHKANSADRMPVEEDWRGDLLTALCGVFDKEREALMAELRSYVITHPQDAMAKRLEQRISDQESLQRSALDQVHLADRQSLLTEIGALRKKASLSRQQTNEQQQTYSEKMSALEDQSAKRERQQQRQIQVLEYKLQQEKVIQDDLKTSLDLERQRVREVSSELSREKNAGLEVQGELSTVQIQLSKARDALEREHNRYTSVTDALEEERTKNSRLSDLLEAEKRKCTLLDSQVLDLRSHNKDYLEKESRFVEQLRIELEREREKRVECARQAEQERGAKHGAQQELEEERRRMRSHQSDSEALAAQLKLSLDAERTKIDDLNRKLDEEHQTLTRHRATLDQERNQHQEAANQNQEMIEDIEARLRAEQTQVEDLHRSLARERQKLASVSDMLETERENMRHTMEHERAVCRQLKRDTDDLQNERSDLKRQLEFERETVKTYQNQTEQLQEEVKVLKQRENEHLKRSDSNQGAARKTIRELERDRDQLNIRVHELELETDRLRDKLQDTQLQLENIQGRELQVRHELDRLRLTTTSQQMSATRDRMAAPVETTSSSGGGLRHDTLDNYIQRLEFLALRMQDDAALISQPHGGDDVVDAQIDTSPNYVSDIQGLVSDMKELRQPLSSNEVGSSMSAGQLANERIVKHNDELTAFLKRVCREKEELRMAMDSLEEELAKNRSQSRQQQVRRVSDEEEEDRYLEDRMSWASERLSLQMALDSAEHESNRLQAEVRLVRSQLNSEGYLTEADREKMQRLYGKFLRAESFRKALVYQKRYLLLLLGGYQDCEQETLMLIAQMGGYPSDIDVQRRRRHTRFFSLFRSAARVIIAICRMRFMVRKWRRAIRVGSPVVSGRVNLNLGYMPSSSSYSPPRPTSSPRHFPSMSRIPDFPRSSTSEPLIALNGDLANPYHPSTSGSTNRRHFTTPPTKDTSASQRSCDRSLTSSARRRVLQDTNNLSLTSRPYRVAAADESTDDFLHRLENLQTRLGSYDTGAPSSRTTAWR